MSAVIEFPAARIRPVILAAGKASAEIIIFPGIRVERMSGELDERLLAPRNGSIPLARAKE
jgi:hypothetical protein